MIDVAIDPVLVDVRGEQFTDDEKNLRVGGVEGEAACVCHHTAVDGCSKLLGHLLEAVELPDDAEDEFTGAGCLRTGDGQYGRHIRVEVVVDEYAWGRG